MNKIVLILITILSLNVYSSEMGKVAVFDRDLIYKKTYKYIHLLTVDKETKSKLISLEKEIDTKQNNVMLTKNKDELDKLTKEINFLKYKQRTIQSNIPDFNHTAKKEAAIENFIKENYKVEFTALVNTKYLKNNNLHIIINVAPIDITERIIKDLHQKAYK